MLYSLQRLTRTYGERTILDIEHLEIRLGKVYTLIGPNGAGKTSLLKIMAFLDRPTSGTVDFLNNRVEYTDKNLFFLRRRVVLLDQNPIMFTGSVLDNVEFGLKIRNIPQRRKKAMEALQLVGMENFACRYAGNLSGGETKRVALARALAFRPEVLLCDEPTANVDNENQEIIFNIIKNINYLENTSVVFSTHYLSQGQRLADFTLLLQNGVISDQVGDNIFRVRILDRRSDKIYCHFTEQLVLQLPATLLAPEIRIAELVVDPREILISPRNCNMADGSQLRGKVIRLGLENTGARIVVDVGVKLVIIISMEQYHRLRPCLGELLELFIPHAAVSCTAKSIIPAD